MSKPKYFTTFQVAKHLGVATATVVNWVNSGRLAAHRTPGGHRRIARTVLIAFAREHDYPLAREVLEHEEGPRRVLVVDDERDFAEMVSEYLRAHAGFVAETAESGFAAGLGVARFRPDIVLMDIMMPGMDGFEALRMLRSDAETCHIPVIACSGYRGEELEQRVAGARFDGFLQKPVRLEAVLQLIQKHLPSLSP